MIEFNVYAVLGYMIGIGALFGFLFNFLRGEAVKDCLHNIGLGVTGSCIGTLVGLNLPVVPDKRVQVVIAMTTLIGFYFLVGHWMIARGATPVRRAMDNYGQPLEIMDEHEIDIRDNRLHPQEPAA